MVIVKVACWGRSVVVLVELGVVEQRYQAVLEVVNQGVSVTEVAVPVRGDAPVGASLVAPVRGARVWPGWWTVRRSRCRVRIRWRRR